MATVKQVPGDIKLEKTVFFMCDIQLKFSPIISYFKEILEVSGRLVSVDQNMNMLCKD